MKFSRVLAIILIAAALIVYFGRDSKALNYNPKIYCSIEVGNDQVTWTFISINLKKGGKAIYSELEYDKNDVLTVAPDGKRPLWFVDRVTDETSMFVPFDDPRYAIGFSTNGAFKRDGIFFFPALFVKNGKTLGTGACGIAAPGIPS